MFMRKIMGLRVIVCCILAFRFSLSVAEDLQVTVKGATSIATTDDNFVCATIDWWPVNKCDYNQCPWGKAGILNLDLKNKILFNAIKSFNPMRIRLGGSLQDRVVYNVGNSIKKCSHFKRRDDGLFGFSKGCLHMDKWDEINNLFNQTGVKLTFGVNALIGKKPSKDDKELYIGEWFSQNAHDLMEYTIKKGYKIDSYELGNEISSSGIHARIEVEQYAKDFLALKEMVTKLYPDASTRPKLLGPAGFYEAKWYNELLRLTGPYVVDAVTHHIYNLGAGVDKDLINKVQDPYYLNQIAQTYKDISESVKEFGPWSGAWVGEAGGAYNSGGKDVSHTFANGFWYLDQLGMTATFNHKVFCRQTLIGGNYALLNTTTFIPNPDYYGALLWHRLMGKTVLSTTHSGNPYLRTYSHCSRNKPGITLILINLSNSTSFNVSVVNDENLYNTGFRVSNVISRDLQQREEYHLTPKDGNIQSDVVLLNGTPLQLTNSSDIPQMEPKLEDSSSPITVAPDSIVFATLRDFKAPACA